MIIDVDEIACVERQETPPTLIITLKSGKEIKEINDSGYIDRKYDHITSMLEGSSRKMVYV